MKPKAAQINYRKEPISTLNNWAKWFPFILVLITFLVYSNSLQNGYNLDDELVTRNHPLTSKGLTALGEIFNSPYYQDESGYSFGYRPIVLISFAIEHELFGEDPKVGHFINLLIYIVTILLGFKLLLKWLEEDKKWIAFISLLIFAVHPLHTEVVDSLKNRDELLSFLFLLVSINFLINKSKEKISFWRFAFFLLFLILSLWSKISSLPFFLCTPLLYFKLFSKKPLFYFFVSIAFSIVIASVGSSFNFSTGSKLFLIEMIISFIIYIIMNYNDFSFNYSIFFNAFEGNATYLFFTFLFLLSFSIIIQSFLLLSMAFALLILIPFFESLSEEILTIIIIYSLIISGFYFEINEFYDISSMICLYIIANKINGSKITFTIIFFIIPLFVIKGEFASLSQIFGHIQGIFILIIAKKRWVSILLLVALGIRILITDTVEIDEVIIAILIAFNFVKRDNRSIRLPYQLIISTIIIFLINFSYNQGTPIHSIETKSEVLLYKKAKQIYSSEGRQLNFVENPLVNSSSTKKKVSLGFITISKYARLFILPYPLKYYYGYNSLEHNTFLSFEAIVGILIIYLTGLALVFFSLKMKYEMIFFVSGSFLSLAMFSNWFELVAGVVGERFVFQTSFFVITLLIIFFLGRKNSLSYYKSGLLLFIFSCFAFLTFNRNFDWKSNITLMSKDIKVNLNSPQANNLFAFSLMRDSYENINLSPEEVKAERKKAIFHLKKAVEIYPEFSNAWYDIGRAAMSTYDTVLAIKGFAKSIELNQSFPDAYYNLLSIYEAQNNRKAHLIFARKLYNTIPDPETVIMMAKSLVANQKLDSAHIVLNDGLKKFKNNARILSNISELDTYEKQFSNELTKK